MKNWNRITDPEELLRRLDEPGVWIMVQANGRLVIAGERTHVDLDLAYDLVDRGLLRLVNPYCIRKPRE
jgi:TATA-box binding protein (TBP) (component of TFIID and TFIIIB)